MTRQRYQQGTIRFRAGRVYGEWRTEADTSGNRQRKGVTLGARDDYPSSKALARRKALEQLRPHIEAYYAGLSSLAIKGSMTVSAFVRDVFLPTYEPGWTLNTRAGLKSALKNHILAQLGTQPMNSILKAHVVQRINDMRAAGYAKRTIRIVKWLLTAIFEEAVDNEVIVTTPMRRMKRLLKGMSDGEETRPFSEDEVRRIFASTEGRNHVWWRTMLLCGLRPGEAAALRRNDVGMSLRIDEAYERRQFGPPKNKKVRSVPLSPALRAELQAWLENVPADAKALLFTQNGRPLNERDRRDLVQLPTREATGIVDLTLKMARATFATLLRTDPKDVQEMLGHSDVETTMRHYRKPIPERQAKAVDELERRLRPVLKIVAGGRK